MYIQINIITPLKFTNKILPCIKYIRWVFIFVGYSEIGSIRLCIIIFNTSRTFFPTHFIKKDMFIMDVKLTLVQARDDRLRVDFCFCSRSVEFQKLYYI